MMRAVRFLVVLAGLLAPIAAAAGPYEDGLAAAQQGDYATALKLMRPLAEQGDSLAQWFLAGMYVSGKGVPQDYIEAVKWLRRGAEQGDATNQNGLGDMYSDGLGVPQDYAEAVKWYRRAAEQGEAFAQNNLGVRYANGEGVPQDYILAHKWYNLAASRFPPFMKEPRELAVRNRDLVAGKMTPAQIAEAQKLAREWKPKPER